MTVLTDELARSFDASTGPTSEARTLPPVVYTSADFFDFEKQAIFGHEWLCVGRTSQVPEPGDYVSVTIVDEPLVVVRGKDGVVRVLSSVCQHRGMVVAEGAGRCGTFKCPYHHWIYGLDGRLLGAQSMERAAGFSKADHGLPELRTEEWHGFLFCTFDPDAPPLAPRLAKLEPYVAHLDLERCVGRPQTDRFTDMPWNWKVMFENFNDGYHANKLHQGVHDFCRSEDAAFVDWDDSDAAIFRTNGFTHIDGGFNAVQRALLPVFPGMTEEERSRAVFALLPPTLTLGIAPDQVFYFLIRPLSAGTIDIEIGYLFHPAALDDPLFEEKFALSSVGVQGIVAQDVHATTQVQRGLRSRFAPRGRYAWQEESHRQFNRWLVQRYRAHWPAPAATATPVQVGR
jgi:phenylpropionate dioxygenase-like ring-hydroxylating dioxygenase large terminal subunit